MKAFSKVRSHATRIFGIVFGTSLALALFAGDAFAVPKTTPPPAAAQTPPPEATVNPNAEKIRREEWRAAVARKPAPKKGCFRAVYPSTELKEEPCTVAPNKPYPPARGVKPQTVGNGTDFAAQTTALISSATGSWDDATTVTSEINGSGPVNDYSLQINSSFFSSPTCNNGGCLGWEQFVYTNTGAAFMQYWLINYTLPCPGGWNTYGSDCWMNSAAIGVPVQPLANFRNLSLTGIAANGGLDTFNFSDGTTIYATTGNDNVVGLAANWKLAEYNVFGDCCGSQANFNSGAHIIVRTAINDGTMNAPTCPTSGFTGETNNLSLVLCCPYGGATPHIAFDESNNAAPTAICTSGTAVGDVHLTNYNHLYYDFQAAGDFLLAQAGPDLIVETRQVSGAPSWPTATTNKYVAMQMGRDRVGVCTLPNRLVVDGKARDLADGQSLALSGLSITRNGDTYTFTRPNGDNVQTTINTNSSNTWIDVHVDLDNPGSRSVRGLLGNSAGNGGGLNDLVSRTGTVLHQPIAFNDLYNVYGDSWRVDSKESLPEQLCGAGARLETRNPERAFLVSDLKSDIAGRARAVCSHEGVKEGPLLDSCTLDTAFFGGDKRAALVFAGRNERIAGVFVSAPDPRMVLKLNLEHIKKPPTTHVLVPNQ